MRGRVRQMAAGRVIASWVWLLLGCSATEIDWKIHAISGKVVKQNGESFPGGVIEFRRNDGKQLNAVGEVRADGQFSVVTIFANQRMNGMAEGLYRVVVSTPMDVRQSSQHLESAESLLVTGPRSDVVIVVGEAE